MDHQCNICSRLSGCLFLSLTQETDVRLLCLPVSDQAGEGLEDFAELFRQLTGDRSAIKVYC